MNGDLKLITKQKKLKPQYIFFIAATLSLLATYGVYLIIVGGSYSHAIITPGTVDIESVKTALSRDDVVKITGIHQNQNKTIEINETLIDLESIGSGEVELSIEYTEKPFNHFELFPENIPNTKTDMTNKASEHIKETVSFYVLPFGLIYDITNDSFSGLWATLILISAQSLVLTITLAVSLYQKSKKGDYSYSMVALFGVIIFMVVSFTVSTLTTLLADSEYLSFMRTSSLVNILFDSGRTFLFLTIIPLIIFCIVLSISNIILARREGFRLQNLLGILLGFSVIDGLALVNVLGNQIYSGSGLKQYVFMVLNTAFIYIFCYFECMLFATMACAISSTKYKIKELMDYIIILGCEIRPDGSPAPLLKGRIDRALEFERAQFEKTGYRAKFVPSGGQGSDEIISEAECMKRYLVSRGVPDEHILKEDKSVNTYQNMEFSKKVIEDDCGDSEKVKIAFSTTNFHVFRGYTLAKKLNMKARGLSAKTKYYFFPNAFLREFVGLLWEKKKVHILFIGSIFVFFAIIYFLIKY